MLPLGDLEFPFELKAETDAEEVWDGDGVFVPNTTVGRSLLGLIALLVVPVPFRLALSLPFSLGLSLSLSLRMKELMRSLALDFDLPMVAAGSVPLEPVSEGGVVCGEESAGMGGIGMAATAAVVVLLTKSAPRSWSEGCL